MKEAVTSTPTQALMRAMLPDAKTSPVCPRGRMFVSKGRPTRSEPTPIRAYEPAPTASIVLYYSVGRDTSEGLSVFADINEHGCSGENDASLKAATWGERTVQPNVKPEDNHDQQPR